MNYSDLYVDVQSLLGQASITLDMPIILPPLRYHNLLAVITNGWTDRHVDVTDEYRVAFRI